MTGSGFTVWITGSDEAAVERVGEEVASRLAARHLAVDLLAPRTPGVAALAGERREERMAFVAAALARHGVATVVALPAPARAARDRARAELGRMIEVYVHGAGADPPAYEAPDRAEVEVVVPETSPGAGAERTVRTLELLGLIGREEGGYSEDEEREVIRRLKAFGYL
jgi:NAD(P)-dependent dehydrogenase (short-subunit alcohol dehydrogenase family)